MSRTWIHAPHYALRLNPKYRHAFEVIHHHENGMCDYDPDDRGGRYYINHCYWAFRWNIRTCSCQMCSGQFARKYNRRVIRMHERTQRQHILAQVDRDDAEIFWDGRASRCWW